MIHLRTGQHIDVHQCRPCLIYPRSTLRRRKKSARGLASASKIQPRGPSKGNKEEMMSMQSPRHSLLFASLLLATISGVPAIGQTLPMPVLASANTGVGGRHGPTTATASLIARYTEIRCGPPRSRGSGQLGTVIALRKPAFSTIRAARYGQRCPRGRALEKSPVVLRI